MDEVADDPELLKAHTVFVCDGAAETDTENPILESARACGLTHRCGKHGWGDGCARWNLCCVVSVALDSDGLAAVVSVVSGLALTVNTDVGVGLLLTLLLSLEIEANVCVIHITVATTSDIAASATSTAEADTNRCCVAACSALPALTTKTNADAISDTATIARIVDVSTLTPCASNAGTLADTDTVRISHGDVADHHQSRNSQP